MSLFLLPLSWTIVESLLHNPMHIQNQLPQACMHACNCHQRANTKHHTKDIHSHNAYTFVSLTSFCSITSHSIPQFLIIPWSQQLPPKPIISANYWQGNPTNINMIIIDLQHKWNPSRGVGNSHSDVHHAYRFVLPPRCTGLGT